MVFNLLSVGQKILSRNIRNMIRELNGDTFSRITGFASKNGKFGGGEEKRMQMAKQDFRAFRRDRR